MLRGWVFTPRRMGALIQGILDGYGLKAKKEFHLQLFDGIHLMPPYDGGHAAI